MHSGQVNASQLLASFLGSENEKIGQSIAQNDFAGELKKFIPAPAKGATIPGDASQLPEAKPQNVSSPGSGQQALSAKTQAAPQTKPSGPTVTRQRKSATDTRTKIDSMKAKAKQEASLFIANPIADTILGDLQCPAEIRKACNGNQSQDGSISIKDLKSLLDTQPANGSTDRAQVPAEHARALVESVMAKEGGTSQQSFASEGTLQSSIPIKTEGSYTPGEFKGLLDKVLQVAATQQKQLIGSGALSGSAEPAKTSEGLKTSQTENLTATVLPSFISEDVGTGNFEKVSVKNTFVSQSKSPSPETQSVNAGDVRKNSTDSVTDDLKYDERLIAAKFPTQNRDLDGAALGMEAGTKGGSGQAGPTTGPATASPAVLQEAAQMPLKGLDPILENLNAVIISAGQPQPETKSAAIPAPGAPHDGSVAQAQNLASPVKGAEKQADRSRGALNSSRLPQDVTKQSEAAQIKTVEAEYPSNERSFDSGPNLAGTSQKIQAKPQAPATGQEKMTVEFQQTAPGVGTDGKTTPKETLVQTGQEAIPAAESLSSKSRDSIKGFEQRVDLSSSVKSADAVPKNEAQAVAAETDSKEIPVELRQTSQGVEADGKTTPNETLVQTGEEAIPAAESLSSKSRDSIDGFEKRVDLSSSVKPADAFPPNGTQTVGAKTDSKETPVELRQTSQGIEIAGKAVSAVAGEKPADTGGKMASQQQVPDVPWGFGSPTEDVLSRTNASVFVDGSNSGASLHESAPATSGMDAQKAAETQTAISGQNTAILSKQIEKQSGSSDSAPESAVLQSSTQGFQGVSQVNAARMDNPAGNGFTYYDPYRSAELAQNMREQVTGAGARQLVLEMEPDELGKISIKVGAKKDEISVVAQTQSVDAREALMKHSPELRQDLKDQGLVLDKFTVDVNGEKSGGGNYPEANKAADKIKPPSKTAKAGSSQISGGNVYIRKTDSRSQISIFA
jgi:flagellar hook-length control protein FliK